MLTMQRVASSLLSRSRATRSLATSPKVKSAHGTEKAAFALSASALAIAMSACLPSVVPSTGASIKTVACDAIKDDKKPDRTTADEIMEKLDQAAADEIMEENTDVEIVIDEDSDLEEGFTESIRFEQCIAYHRMLLPEYRQRWDYSNEANRKTPTSTWPRHVPIAKEIPSLEADFAYCNRKAGKQQQQHQPDMVRETYCDNLMFRLAAFYLNQVENTELQRKGFKFVKDLAERGHADAMCLYGMVLNEGRLPGVEANPGLATVWWRRAVDDHRHVASTYELAVAFFTGEGTAENEEMAVNYFRRAATLGHPGAAYMLGDCLLDGIGTRRDRAEALEWLVTAGELGHRGARSRVLAVLEMKEGEDYGKFTDSSRQSLADSVSPIEDDEQKKWNYGEEDGTVLKEASIERRFTIGGGSRNPVILERRKTVVAESRKP